MAFNKPSLLSFFAQHCIITDTSLSFRDLTTHNTTLTLHKHCTLKASKPHAIIIYKSLLIACVVSVQCLCSVSAVNYDFNNLIFKLLSSKMQCFSK